MKTFLFSLVSALLACNLSLVREGDRNPLKRTGELLETPLQNVNFQPGSWEHFLQNLPEEQGPVLDFRGHKIAAQQKHAALLKFDVGTRDLQQCADALMRLRAEYLFKEKRYQEMGFHFTDGTYYTWDQYCHGKRPAYSGNKLRMISTAPCERTHEALRSYLDIVYTYAGTISLARELKKADGFKVGTIVIHSGSPGHCLIITDEVRDGKGRKLFKLVEGYTPAQSIYVLKNPSDPKQSWWYSLKKGPIKTSSYEFLNYELKKFE